MQITSELGQEILMRLAEYIDVDINIMDLHGIIVASTNRDRINEVHSGSLQVIDSGEELILDEENISLYPRTQPGVNLPIMYQDRILGVVGVSGNPSEIIRLTGLVRVSVEIVLGQIYIQRQIHYKEIQWNNWVHQLLHPTGYDEEKLRKESEYTLHVDVAQEWRVIIIFGNQLNKYIEEIRSNAVYTRLDSLFMLLFTDKEFLITVPVSCEQLNKFLNHLTIEGTTVGIGEAAFGISGIRQSYKQAKQALSLNGGKDRITYSEDWKIERLARSISETEYNSICLPYENLLNSLEYPFIETIDTYFEMNFSIKETANKLHIHRNTLLYRLDQIKEKTGLEPRIFRDAFILKILRNR